MSEQSKLSLKKRILIAVAIVLAIILILVGVGVGVIFHYIGKIDIDTNPTWTSGDSTVSEFDELTSEDLANLESGVSDTPESEMQSYYDDMKEIQENELLNSDKVMNILLIGTDGRKVTERGRSDSMILVSVNKVTKKIYLTSIMRDILVDIPGVTNNNRINASYSFGGPDLLMATIEQNFRVKVDKYVSINFESFKTVVEYLGGIEMTVTDAEAKRIEGLEKGGTYVLNGEQALAYSRIRKIGGDFERTNRQRKVLEIIIERCKKLNVFQLMDIMDFVLPQVSTNMPKSEIFGHVMSAPTYTSYEVVSQRLPCDGSWKYLTVRGMAVIGINFGTNFDYLKETAYAGVYK